MASCKCCTHYRVCKYANSDEYASIAKLKDACQNCIELITVIRAMEAERKMVELEAEITAALESNYKAKAIDTADDFVAYCEGRIHALRGLARFIEELKKKYTEGEQ